MSSWRLNLKNQDRFVLWSYKTDHMEDISDSHYVLKLTFINKTQAF